MICPRGDGKPFAQSNIWTVYSRFNQNGFVGTIPSELGELVQLHELWMHLNLFTGVVPAALGNMKDSLSKRLRNVRGHHVRVPLTGFFSFLSGYSSWRKSFQWNHPRGILQSHFTVARGSSAEQVRRNIQYQYRTAHQHADSSSVQKPADWSAPCAARKHRRTALGMAALESFHRQCT